MSIPFKYCSNLTDGEITTIALAGGITAAVCGVASFTVLVLLALVNCSHHRVCETVVKRLVVGFIASSVPFQLVTALHLIHYFHPEQENFCKADGFFHLYLAVVQLVFALVISLVLFLKVCGVTTSWKCHHKDATFTCCGWKINKLEILLFVSVFCLPLLFDWIPFTTDSYGPFGPSCWIRRLENNCSIHKAGIFETILLWDVPSLSVGLLALGLFIISLCLLGYAIKNANAKMVKKMGITNSIFSLALVFTLYLLRAALLFNPSESSQFAFWMLIAIFTPIFSFLVALALLVVIHFPLSSMFTCLCCNCHGRTHTNLAPDKSDEAAVHASSDWSVINQPSHTTWKPPHSTNPDSQVTPLASEKQLHEYGSMV